MALKNADIVTNILARLENIELREELHDTYFQNTTLPTITNKNVINKFGTLTQDQLEQMIANAISGSDLRNAPKWLQYLFGGILSQPVRLTTYLSAKKKVIETLTNYKSYIELCEDVKADPATRSRDTLYLRDADVNIAYVLSVYKDIYVGSILADQYKNFTSAGNNPSTKEGLKIKHYGYTIINSVKEKAVNDLLSKLQSEQDKHIIATLAKDTGLNTLLADTACLAAVDALNNGTFSERYGGLFKAALALKSNNLLQNISGVESLATSHPNIATDIETKLNDATQQRSVYWVDPNKLRIAVQKMRSTQNPNTASINNFVSTYQNLVSSIGQCLGDTKMDLDEFFVLPLEQKKASFLNLAGNGFFEAVDSNPKTLRNSFMRIVTRDMVHCFGISPDVMHGWTFMNTEGTFDASNVMTPKDSAYRDLKTPLLDDSVHNYIVHKAATRYVNGIGPITAGMYAQTFADEETKSDAQQNAGQGQKTVKEQLLNVLAHLFDENTQRLRTGVVLFASVPSIIALGAKTPILVSDEPATTTGQVLNRDTVSDYRLNKLKPLSFYYDKYMDILLNPNSKEEVREIKRSFITIVNNLSLGVWSYEGFTLGDNSPALACFSAFNTATSTKELHLEDFLLQANALNHIRDRYEKVK